MLVWLKDAFNMHTNTDIKPNPVFRSQMFSQAVQLQWKDPTEMWSSAGCIELAKLRDWWILVNPPNQCQTLDSSCKAPKNSKETSLWQFITIVSSTFPHLLVLDCCPHFNIRRNTKSSFQIKILLITENLSAPGCKGNYPANLITDDNNQQPASISHGCQSLGRRTGFKFHFCCLIPKVGNLRSGGHMWPKEVFHRTHGAFTLIFLQAKLKGVSFIS